jgi:uncharacterized lipoprotein YajG
MKQIITSNKTILAAALLTLGLTGCALTPATESLNYQAQTGVAHVAHAENVTVNVVATDSRVDKAIGYKKNALNMKMTIAGISADKPIDVIVGNAIEEELKAHGFQINKNSNLKITVDVTKFYNEFDVKFASADANAETGISVNVFNSGNVVYTKSINRKNTETSYFAASPGLAKTSLENALNKAIAELFNDPLFINTLISVSGTKSTSLN